VFGCGRAGGGGRRRRAAAKGGQPRPCQASSRAERSDCAMHRSCLCKAAALTEDYNRMGGRRVTSGRVLCSDAGRLRRKEDMRQVRISPEERLARAEGLA